MINSIIFYTNHNDKFYRLIPLTPTLSRSRGRGRKRDKFMHKFHSVIPRVANVVRSYVLGFCMNRYKPRPRGGAEGTFYILGYCMNFVQPRPRGADEVRFYTPR